MIWRLISAASGSLAPHAFEYLTSPTLQLSAISKDQKVKKSFLAES
jgi:hypothetical protein